MGHDSKDCKHDEIFFMLAYAYLAGCTGFIHSVSDYRCHPLINMALATWMQPYQTIDLRSGARSAEDEGLLQQLYMVCYNYYK